MLSEQIREGFKLVRELLVELRLHREALDKLTKSRIGSP